MTTQELIQMSEEYGAHNYHPLPIVISKADGIWVWDPEGKKYLDMLSCYSAVNQGHCHKKIIKALKDQADKVTLTSRAFHNDKIGPFLKKIVEYCQMEMCLPMNTGAEAVETAIKAVRKWGYKHKGIKSGKAEIIVCDNNFHGRTITVISFSTEKSYKKGFEPLTPGFTSIPFGDYKAFKKAVNKNTVAFLVEPIQGEGGINMPNPDFFKKVRRLCDKEKILLVMDEIQTGLGRTGKRFAHEYEEIKPDMLILGKALAGGVLPVSAVVSSKEVLGVFKPGDHGSTFGGNPLGCAVAMASIDVLEDEKLTEKAYELGEYFMEKLNNIKSPYVKEVRGRGLLIGVELKKSAGGARKFCEKLMELGLLCKETHEHIIRFAPPLVITKKDIDWSIEKIEKVLTETS